jgi:AhpD family alkylhydroperoxidase
MTMQDVEWEECLLEPRHDPEIEREFRRAGIRVLPPSVPYLSYAPWVARYALDVRPDGPLVHTSFELNDLIFLAVSQDNSCRFCYSAWRALLRLQGYPEDRIGRLEQDFFTAELDEHDRMAIDFAKRISRANPLPSAADLEALLEEGFTDGEIKEIAVRAGFTVYANHVTTLPAIPHHLIDELVAKWWVRLLRPLLARGIRNRRRGNPEFLAPEQRTGPYAYVIQALDGLPLAGVIRGSLDAAWASPILPPRTKALIFAVVARGVGSPLAERESLRLLAKEGLEHDQAQEILSHLASPALDEVEAASLPLARESIRYRPGPIQRRAREVRKRLTPEQFVELVGLIGSANMVCRLETICETG